MKASMPRLAKLLLVSFHVVLAAFLVTGPLAGLAAQSEAGSIGGMRAYWHVFIAYAIVIVAVLGWVVSIGRRLKDIQDRLGK
jgi:CcmD family protein